MGRLEGSRVLYSSASSTGLAMNKSPRWPQIGGEGQREVGSDGVVKW